MSFTLSTLVWFLLIIGFAVLEAVTVGLISIWFAAGALAAFLISFFTANVWVQAFVFLAVTALTLLFTRPLLKRSTPDVLPANMNLNIGKQGTVIAAITPGFSGRVRLDGVDWNARSDEALAEGSTCVVLAVHSATLQVASTATIPEKA